MVDAIKISFDIQCVCLPPVMSDAESVICTKVNEINQLGANNHTIMCQFSINSDSRNINSDN